MADTGDECSKEGKGYEGSRPNGESLSDGGSCVAGRVKGISLFANIGLKFGHLSDTCGIWHVTSIK